MIFKSKPALFIAVAVLVLLAAPLAAQEGSSVAGLDRVVTQIDSLFPPLEGFVVSVDGDTVILDLKQGQPIKKGDRLKLIRYGKEIIHPVTRKKIGRQETDLGEVEILDVRKDFTVARPTDPTVEVRPGDGVRSAFKKLFFLVAPIRAKTKKKIDTDRLRLDLETRLNRHARFEIPAFDLGVWLLENRLNSEKLMRRENLRKLRNRVQVDYILVPTVRQLKKKMVLGYQLYSAIDGTLKTRSQVLSDRLPVVPKRTRRPREQDVQTSFASPRKGLLKFVGVHEFKFEVVDFDIGDLDGDGTREFIFIDRYRIMIFHYKNNKFQRVTQVKTDEVANHFLSVDTADINGNGRDEIFVTNQVGDALQSFVLEVVPGRKRLKKIWKDVDLYFRVIHPFGSKPTLLAQSPGYNDPFQGPVKTIRFRGGRYLEGPELKIKPIYGHQFILYGLTQADVNSNKTKETILLDKNYRLRVYSPNGRLLVKSDDYYGHDPRLISLGVKSEIGGVVQQGEPVHYRGRLEFVKSGERRFLFLPRNHRVGGSLLSKMVIVNNSSLVVLGVSDEGFEKVFETKKQKGYLAAYQVMTTPEKGMQVHVATVEPGRFGKKTVSRIFTYTLRKPTGGD